METTIEAELVDPLEDFLGYQLRCASAAAMAHLANALSSEDVSPSVATVLLMIRANPGRTQARIGRALSIKRANIAPMIATLEENGLVRRENNDGRSFGLVCTASGIKTARRIKQTMADHEDKVFQSLDAKTYAQLAKVLKKLRRRNQSALEA